MPDEPPNVVASIILDLMKELRSNMSTTTLHLSAILPKYGPGWLPGINEINWLVARHSGSISYSFISHPKFSSFGKMHNRRICKDVLPPCVAGVAQLARDILY